MRDFLRGASLVGGLVGFLLSLVWGLVEVVCGEKSFDDLPAWLGVPIFGCVLYYGYWELRDLMTTVREAGEKAAAAQRNVAHSKPPSSNRPLA